MRGRMFVPAMLSLMVFAGVGIAGAGATPSVRDSTCTAAEKSQREAAVAAFLKQMAPQRQAYFAHHSSAQLRRAFVGKQQAHLRQLRQLAACTVTEPPTSASRFAGLRTYAAAMGALQPMFDPDLTAPADDALTVITAHEEGCDTDPEQFECPVPLSEYKSTAAALRDAAAEFGKLSGKLAVIVPPPMTLAEYSDAIKAAADDCGVSLATVAAAHRDFLETTTRWERTLGEWADTYAAGKSVDWDTVEYLPGSSAVWEHSQGALLLWSVMVTSYWRSLAPRVASAPDVPAWIGDLYDGECPAPD